MRPEKSFASGGGGGSGLSPPGTAGLSVQMASNRAKPENAASAENSKPRRLLVSCVMPLVSHIARRGTSTLRSGSVIHYERKTGILADAGL